MEIIFAVIALVLGISLYDYLTSRNWQQVTSSTRNDLVFEHRNQEYGAYVIRKDYNSRMLIIMLCVTLGIGVIYAVHKIIQSIPEEIVPPPPIDDSTFAVAAPPVEEETPPPPPEPEIPEMEQTVQFVPPVVVDNPDVEEPTTVDETEDTRASTTTQAGTDDFVEPVTTGPVIVEKPKVEEIPTIVDEYASFPGGAAAMKKFLGENLNYPQTAIEEELEGKCFLSFIVDTDGSISNVTVTRKVPGCPECDKEAVRVVNKMPKWTPAKNGGKVTKSKFNLPVTFKLQ